MRVRRLLLLAALGMLVVPATARATFPGANGRIAFDRGGDIWTMNPDGTDQVNLTNDSLTQTKPAWSADGTKIAFTEADPGRTTVWWMLADGSNRTRADNNGTITPRIGPSWSPAGTRIAFANTGGLYTMNPDGTGVFGLPPRGFMHTDWSADGQWIAADVGGTGSQTFNCDYTDIAAVHPDGTGTHAITDYAQTAPCTFYVTGGSWSPDSQRIAFYVQDFSDGGCPAPCSETGFFTAKFDGTDRQRVPGGGLNAVYSPDGAKFAYVAGGIRTMNVDGTGDVAVALGDHPSWQPIFPSSPAADMLATVADSPDPIQAGQDLHYTAFAKNLVGPDTATGVTLTVNLPANVFYVSATPTQGSCNQSSGVVTCNIGSLAKGASASVDIDVEPKSVISNTTITASASASANEPDPVPSNNSSSTTTTVTPGGYPRPHGASPLRVTLVPAYRQCTDNATLTHGAPLSYPSCAAPALTSGSLTAGTPDSNGQPANFTGYVRYRAVGELPIDPNNGDQSDVLLDTVITDVRKASDLSDYTGELRLENALRITDQNSGAGGFTSATLGDLSLPATIPCAATASGSTGANCELHTSFDAITPGVVKERTRAVWALDKVRVFDGGPDGSVSTDPNTVYATQGIFVP